MPQQARLGLDRLEQRGQPDPRVASLVTRVPLEVQVLRAKQARQAKRDRPEQPEVPVLRALRALPQGILVPLDLPGLPEQQGLRDLREQLALQVQQGLKAILEELEVLGKLEGLVQLALLDRQERRAQLERLVQRSLSLVPQTNPRAE